MAGEAVRPDHAWILDRVEPGSRVLDLGCGDGDLLRLLAERKGAVVQGIELDERAVYACVAKGISVFHGDIDSGLPEYPDDSFDYVILDQSLQEVRQVELVLREARRVARRGVIVGFSNFAHWQARWMLGARGRAPVTESLPYRWHDTPNVRFLSVRDFRDYCREKGIPVLAARFLGARGTLHLWPNLRALNALFLLQGTTVEPAGRLPSVNRRCIINNSRSSCTLEGDCS